MFIRNESFKTFLRSYPVVSIILAINIIVYLLFFIDRYLHTGVGYLLLQYGVGFNAGIEYGQWWRLVTAIFLHISFSHVLFNCFSIFLFAPALENMLGKFKFIILYLGTGIIGNLATFFLQPMEFSYLGASGAIYGLLGLYLFMAALRKDLIDHQNRTVIIVILVIGLVSTFIYPNTDILGHLFGLLAGFAFAPLFLIGIRNIVR